MQKYKVSEQHTLKDYEIEIDETTVKINGEDIKVDIRNTGKNIYHIIYNNRSVTAEVVEYIAEEKTCKVKINDHLYILSLKNPLDQLLQKMGITAHAATKATGLKAPMPGLVLDIMVKQGQQVKKGDPLLVLEAMKMENILKATSDGLVSKVMVAKGVKVEKNTELIIIE